MVRHDLYGEADQVEADDDEEVRRISVERGVGAIGWCCVVDCDEFDRDISIW